MLIKEAKYKTVMVKRQEEVSPAIYGCDCCGKELPDYPNESVRLDMTVFYRNDKNEYIHLCSWDCVFLYIQENKDRFDYFITLPHLHFDENDEEFRDKTGVRLLEIIEGMVSKKIIKNGGK